MIFAVIAALAIVGLIVWALRDTAEPNAGANAKTVTPPEGPKPLTADNAIGIVNDCPGLFFWDIVGESHYQDALSEICGGKCDGGHSKICDAYLVPEDSNPHDAQAIAVFIGKKKVGYLARDIARQWRRAGKKDERGIVFVAQVPAKIVGGWDDGQGSTGHFGVKIDLPVSE